MAQDSITLDARLSKLLEAWRRLCAAGHAPTPEQVCHGDLDLLETFKEHIQVADAQTFTYFQADARDSRPTAFDSTVPQSSRRGVPPWPGIPGYESLGEGFAGGMGVVYPVRDLNLNRPAAVKVLRSGSYAGAEQTERFLNEGRTLATLNHDHVVRVYGFSYHDGQPYFAMEWVGGGSLDQHLSRLQSDTQAAARVMEKIARAVHYLHQNRVWHRDLKPANILIDELGEPKISDFGLAKLLDENRETTQSMRIAGTVPYMAPEQFQLSGSRCTRQTDIWSLGVTFFEMLTGQRPFAGDSNESLSSCIQSEKPRSLRAVRPELDRRLEVIINKCLAKDPRDRYASAEALAEDLAKFQRDEPILPESWPSRVWRKTRRNPHVPIAVAIALMLLLMGLVSYFHYADPDRPLKEMRRELNEGRSVVLLGETGMPRWHRSAGNAEVELRVHADRPLTLEAWKHSMVELLPEPSITSYAIQAEVCLDETNYGVAGICIAYGERGADIGKEEYLWIFGFRDQGDHIKQKDADGRWLGMAEFGLRKRTKDLPPPNNFFNFTLVPSRGPRLFPVDRGKFHLLELRVSPHSIQVLFDGEMLGEAMREEMKQFQKEIDAPIPGAPMPINNGQPKADAAPPKYRETVGLFVLAGKATFKNVIITPNVDR